MNWTNSCGCLTQVLKFEIKPILKCNFQLVLSQIFETIFDFRKLSHRLNPGPLQGWITLA